MTQPPSRQEEQPVFILHTYPYRETSLVVEMFSHAFGRISALAKGARRPRSLMRGMLQSFQPLVATWSGKSELRNLHGVEWRGGLHVLQGQALICGFYLNELLLRLLPREDAHEALFLHYENALRALTRSDDHAVVLRKFEVALLQELGYAMPLTHEASSGKEIQAANEYLFEPDHGPNPWAPQQSGVQLRGKTLLDMAQDNYADPATQQQSKQLMRALISHYLGDKPLHTRQLLIDLHQL